MTAPLRRAPGSALPQCAFLFRCSATGVRCDARAFSALALSRSRALRRLGAVATRHCTHPPLLAHAPSPPFLARAIPRLPLAAHIVTLLRMCPRYFEDMAAAIKRCELRNAEDVAMLEVLTLLLQKMTTRRTVLAKASARIFSSKLFDCLQELKHRLRAETVERSGPLEFVEMNVDAVLAAINDAARRPPFTSVMLRSVKESSSDRTALLRIQSSAASHRREGVL